MIDIISKKEIENFKYYDFMGYIGVPFFHIGGLKSTEKLAELCHINRYKKILIIGCGTGYSTCHIAKKFGCSIIGVDIAEKMILKAKERALSEKVENLVEFLIGDAHQLPFETNTFDAVITEFVSIFLDKDKVFKEFVRVLKSGGYVGINELYKSSEIPENQAKKIIEAEKIISEIVQLPFKLPTLNDWRKWLEDSSLEEIHLEEFKESGSLKEILRSIYGFIKFPKFFFDVIKYKSSSKVIQERMKLLDKSHSILFRKMNTAKYIGYTLTTGKKFLIQV